MTEYSRAHLSDTVLIKQLKESFARDRRNTAALLADIAEVEARKLYLREGYSSMFAYCVEAFGLSEQAAFKRIRAARKAQQFPAILKAIALGQINLTGVVILSPHLTAANVNALLGAAAGKRNAEIERLIAAQYPQPDLPTRVSAIAPRMAEDSAVAVSDRLSARTVDALSAAAPGLVEAPVPEGTPGHIAPPLLPAPAMAPPPRARRVLKPLAPQRFALQATISQSAHDDLQRALALLGHQVPAADIGQVLERALRALVVELEKRKFAATKKPRKPGQTRDARAIPAHVKRAVWSRDGAQCTYVSDDGHRCSGRSRLEFDHVQPVARGGHSTVGNLRLRCRAHNQYEAECVYGADFMERKLEAARTLGQAPPRGTISARSPA